MRSCTVWLRPASPSLCLTPLHPSYRMILFTALNTSCSLPCMPLPLSCTQFLLILHISAQMSLLRGSFPGNLPQYYVSWCYSMHTGLCRLLWKSLSRVWLFATPWTVVHGIFQARILEWVAFPFSRGASQLRDWTQVSHVAGGFCSSWATGEAPEHWRG